MSIEIAVVIASVLMVASRFLAAAKPVWNWFPKPVAVLLPGVVALVPQVIALIQQTKSWEDLVNYVIASVALVLVGLAPKHGDSAPK